MNHVMKRKTGRVLLHKGTWNGVPIQLWDFSQECVKEKCGIGPVCTYNAYEFPVNSEKADLKEPSPTIMKCPLHAKYLHSVLNAALELLANKNMNKEKAVKLGYNLIPLYNQLFKFKLVEYGLMGSDVMITTAKGDIKVHPVFKMIQDTMKTIIFMWRELGGNKKKIPDPSVGGDSSFIDALYTDGDDIVEEATESEDFEDGTGFNFDSVDKSKVVNQDKPSKRKKNRERNWKAGRTRVYSQKKRKRGPANQAFYDGKD